MMPPNLIKKKVECIISCNAFQKAWLAQLKNINKIITPQIKFLSIDFTD